MTVGWMLVALHLLVVLRDHLAEKHVALRDHHVEPHVGQLGLGLWDEAGQLESATAGSNLLQVNGSCALSQVVPASLRCRQLVAPVALRQCCGNCVCDAP